MLKGIALEAKQAVIHKDIEQKRLKESCVQFEALFLSNLLKSMRKSVVEKGLFGNSNESEIIRSMLDENLAQNIAKGGGIGLGEMLFEKIKNSRMDIFI